MQMLQLLCCARLGSESAQPVLCPAKADKADNTETSSDESSDAFLLDQSQADTALAEGKANTVNLSLNSGSKDAELVLEPTRTEREDKRKERHRDRRAAQAKRAESQVSMEGTASHAYNNTDSATMPRSGDAKKKKEKKETDPEQEKALRAPKEAKQKKDGRTDAPSGGTGTARASQASKPVSKAPWKHFSLHVDFAVCSFYKNMCRIASGTAEQNSFEAGTLSRCVLCRDF